MTHRPRCGGRAPVIARDRFQHRLGKSIGGISPEHNLTVEYQVHPQDCEQKAATSGEYRRHDSYPPGTQCRPSSICRASQCAGYAGRRVRARTRRDHRRPTPQSSNYSRRQDNWQYHTLWYCQFRSWLRGAPRKQRRQRRQRPAARRRRRRRPGGFRRNRWRRRHRWISGRPRWVRRRLRCLPLIDSGCHHLDDAPRCARNGDSCSGTASNGSVVLLITTRQVA